MEFKITSEDFYVRNPSVGHKPGDVWKDIPVSSIGSEMLLNAVVITPSCDLAQGKTEVVNLVPLIPVKDYFYIKPFYNEIFSGVKGILAQFGGVSINRFSLPNPQEVETAIEIMRMSKKTSHKDMEKLIEYAKYIKYSLDRSQEVPDISKIVKINDIISKIIRNSYKSDIHFFPKLNNRTDYTLKEHSVALFRYVFSVDIDILDLASRISPDDWMQASSESNIPDIKKFSSFPVRICQLKGDFLTDFLSRNLNMHLRFGSRDFHTEDVERFVEEVLCTSV